MQRKGIERKKKKENSQERKELMSKEFVVWESLPS